VITGQVLHGFFDVTLWFLIGGLIVLVVVLLAGPYRWAVATRARGRRHLDLFRIGGAVIAALALLIFSVSRVSLLIIAVLLALNEFGLLRLRQTQPAAQPPPAPNARP